MRVEIHRLHAESAREIEAGSDGDMGRGASVVVSFRAEVWADGAEEDLEGTELTFGIDFPADMAGQPLNGLLSTARAGAAEHLRRVAAALDEEV